MLITVAGWTNQAQQQMLEYLRERTACCEQIGDRRLRLNDDQRRRLAVKAKGLGRKWLAELRHSMSTFRGSAALSEDLRFSSANWPHVKFPQFSEIQFPYTMT